MAERGERGERGTSVYAHPYCAEIDRRVRAGEDLRTIAHWLEGCPDDVPRVPLRMLLRYRQHLSDGAKGWASRPGSAHEGARRSIDVEGKQRKLLALLERQLTEAEHDSWRGGPRGPSVGLIRACVGLLRHWKGEGTGSGHAAAKNVQNKATRSARHDAAIVRRSA